MHNKPHKWGYKIWCLVSEGYLLRFDVYTGARTEIKGEKPKEVAQNLISPYYGFNHLVVMDNWYTSIPLFRTLLSHSTFALGTIRSNRKEYPKDLVKTATKKHKGQYL
jgi:hypothetical protein